MEPERPPHHRFIAMKFLPYFTGFSDFFDYGFDACSGRAYPNEVNGNGFRMIKVGTAMLLASSIILALSGIYLYSLYRGGSVGAPESARKIIKASTRPWVHGIMMEMKEFIGVYVPIIIAMMYVVIKTYGAGFVENKKARMMFAVLLTLAVVWTVMTFGLGAFITKTVPL